MLTVKIIGKLKGLIGYLKARAITRQTRALEAAAERVDISTELAEKRIQFAYEMKEKLEQRAHKKLTSDFSDINEIKRVAGANLAELEAL